MPTCLCHLQFLSSASYNFEYKSFNFLCTFISGYFILWSVCLWWHSIIFFDYCSFVRNSFETKKYGSLFCSKIVFLYGVLRFHMIGMCFLFLQKNVNSIILSEGIIWNILRCFCFLKYFCSLWVCCCCLFLALTRDLTWASAVKTQNPNH